MKFMLGKKVGMTQIFTPDGVVIPVTVIQAGPLTVIQKKSEEIDGYVSVKVGYENVKENKLNKYDKRIKDRDSKIKEKKHTEINYQKTGSMLKMPEMGLFKKLNIPAMKYLKEFRVEDTSKFEIGQNIKVADMFKDGDRVDVSGVSKGKGFQGTIKRYGQSGGPETHGSMYHRRVGSMSANTNPARVFKGKKLPGHMGAENVTVMNLDIVKVDSERNLILIKGAVPGPKNSLIVIKNTVKSK